MQFSLLDSSLDLRSIVIGAYRTQLRAVTRDFVPEIFRNFTKDITQYMMPAPAESLSDTEEFVVFAQRALDLREDIHLVITHRRSEEFLGICGLHARGRPREPDVGIWIKQPAHGNGYGLEAVTALISWAGSNIELDRILYPVDRRNAPSRRIPESLGGRVIAETVEETVDGRELDEVIYAIDIPLPKST